METIANAIEPYRQSLGYAPIGLLLCAIPWLILMKITEKIPYVDAAHLRRTLLAFLFTGAYLNIWAQGSNPHDVEIKANTLGDELFLLLAGGYYIVHAQRPSYRRIAHDFLFVVFIVLVIIQGEVAAPANTYGFLVEVPNLFLVLSEFVRKFHFMVITWALRHLSVILYFTSNVDICNIGHSIFGNEKVPVHIKAAFLFLMIFQFLNIIEDVCGLMSKKEETNVVKIKEIKCRTISRRSLC